MITQPIALLLAEKLEQQFPLGTAQHYLDGEAAAELRRLSAQTDNDTALLRQALEALKNSREYIVAEYEQRKALYEGYPHMAYKYQAEANDLASIDALITALKERLGEKT
jgi:hypothetical protein